MADDVFLTKVFGTDYNVAHALKCILAIRAKTFTRTKEDNQITRIVLLATGGTNKLLWPYDNCILQKTALAASLAILLFY